MAQYQTIKKLAEDVGINPSSVRKLLDKGVLTKCRLEGMDRVFVDVEEFNSKMRKETESQIVDVDLTAFQI